MAAKSAAQHCPHLAPFYKKLRAANKPDNVALIAVARKLLIRLNSLLADAAKNTQETAQMAAKYPLIITPSLCGYLSARWGNEFIGH